MCFGLGREYLHIWWSATASASNKYHFWNVFGSAGLSWEEEAETYESSFYKRCLDNNLYIFTPTPYSRDNCERALAFFPSARLFSRHRYVYELFSPSSSQRARSRFWWAAWLTSTLVTAHWNQPVKTHQDLFMFLIYQHHHLHMHTPVSDV